MHKQGVKGFPYYLGVNSLSEIATKKDRVCVLNIMGGESRTVTPVSHVFSGGNIVFGTSPGRSGQKLETKAGNIPVYNSIKEGIKAGHKFNTAVIYLPPAGVKDGVAEAVRHNPQLKKIIILTEKVAVHDARIIRAICQTNGIDVFGANCLGVADAWNGVRIGGALGGSNPKESLVKGTVALFSNSGNFTTTIAVYLLTQGWGTTTSVSSGKDVYIHYGPEEFFHALSNDKRSKAAVIYTEPGGYYEHGLNITKPTVACVVGRWKARLTKACGHAGSLAGSGDDAAAKEKWYMDYFGTKDIYTPGSKHFTKKGAVVTNIAHIPEALTRVMKAAGRKPDFKPRGDLSLKSWFGSNASIQVPKNLDMAPVKAVAPYDEQIALVSNQVGAQLPRQAMKDTSGASMMDPKTQVTKIHGISVLDASKKMLEENLVMSLMKEYPNKYKTKLANIAFNAYVNHSATEAGRAALDAADASRRFGNSPNTALSSAVAVIGKGAVEPSLAAMKLMAEKFRSAGDDAPAGQCCDLKTIIKRLTKAEKKVIAGHKPCKGADQMLRAMESLKGGSCFINFVTEVCDGKPSKAILLSAIWMTIGWQPLQRKAISLDTLVSLPWHSRIFSTFVGCSVPKERHTDKGFCSISNEALIKMSFTQTAFAALIGRKPTKDELFEFTTLLGLLITNGPGTISAQGAKGGVSADGPEDPSRVQINKATIGFLTHTGFAHGGNGYEAIAFLIERFKGAKLKDASSKGHGLNFKKLSLAYAGWYRDYKAEQKSIGNMNYMKIPCINHPVFKGKAVNYDPRERFVTELFEKKGIYNAFLDFYSNMVKSLHSEKVTPNVWCVNIDAVIAVILLKMVWKDFASGALSEEDIEGGAFTTFLFGRMIGCAAEIDDHINRGRNMDTRTAASKCSFVN